MTDPMRSGIVSTATVLLALTAVLLGACAQRSPAPDPADRAVNAGIGEPPLLSARVAQPVQLRQGHPQRYVVQPGDTLWGIASRFLHSPWRWQEIWQQNPAIGNPHLIYPGDVLELYYEGDAPRLRLTRATAQEATTTTTAGERPIVKLSPQIRVEPLSQPIPTVARDAIQAFTSKSRVVSSKVWEVQPYIIGAETDRIHYFNGDRIYVRGGDFLDRPVYQVFRPGETYTDPRTGATLGFQLQYLADAALEDANSDPTVLRLISTESGVRVGDRLFVPDNDDVVFQFLPRPAPADMEGQILATLTGGFLVGRNQSVVLNLGAVDGLEPGHVLVTTNEGQVVTDPVTGEPVLLPTERSGVLMVYEVFDQVSYGLVMEASRTIRLNDTARSPL